MVEFKGGVREAARMLAGLDLEAQNRLLDEIHARDPEMAAKIRKNMVVFEDLIHLTTAMILELLKDVKVETLGMALRMGSKELREHFTSQVSTRMKEEIEEILKGTLQPASKVQEAVTDIMQVVRKKIAAGKIVINPAGTDTYV